jgi:hypothetical protein
MATPNMTRLKMAISGRFVTGKDTVQPLVTYLRDRRRERKQWEELNRRLQELIDRYGEDCSL